MERPEAERQRDRLAAEHPDRETHSFILSESNGEWTVAKAAVPPGGIAASASGTPTPEPAHDQAPGTLPGGVSPWAVGG